MLAAKLDQITADATAQVGHGTDRLEALGSVAGHGVGRGLLESLACEIHALCECESGAGSTAQLDQGERGGDQISRVVLAQAGAEAQRRIGLGPLGADARKQRLAGGGDERVQPIGALRLALCCRLPLGRG
jgi:hypothetical protein